MRWVSEMREDQSLIQNVAPFADQQLVSKRNTADRMDGQLYIKLGAQEFGEITSSVGK